MKNFPTVLLLLGGFCYACAAPKFEVRLAPALGTNALDGRLLLLLSPTNQPEPRLAIEHTDPDGPLVFGRDAERFTPRRAITFDDTATSPLNTKLSQLPAGRYFAQAVLDLSSDLRSPNASGNLVSDVYELQLDSKSRKTVKLELTKLIPDETPADTDSVKFIKIKSELLSQFHRRPIYLRAGVILPRTYANEPPKRFPLWIHIGGYGARYTRVEGMMGQRAPFRADWIARDTPQMIYLQLDGAGPYGDPYQVNSANNGPYGDALVQELIPYVEKNFRGIGKPRARVLSGNSTGGWVALALQIFYPDQFNGAWASSPDSVDFRAYELVNIYEDANAFVNAHGEERPAARDVNGDVRLTMRREVQMENVLGRGGAWTLSGGQWGAWNAVFGPRGADGRPVPLWDANGNINRLVAQQWTKYDLRLVLQDNWTTLAPKLRGKLHIWTGDADNYFLNNSVHLLEKSLAEREPKDVVTFKYGPGQGHGWISLTLIELMKQLGAAADAGR